MTDEDRQHEEIAKRIDGAVTEIHEFVQDIVIVATYRNEDGTLEMFSNFRGTSLCCESAVDSWLERRKNERMLDFLVEKGLISEQNGDGE